MRRIIPEFQAPRADYALDILVKPREIARITFAVEVPSACGRDGSELALLPSDCDHFSSRGLELISKCIAPLHEKHSSRIKHPRNAR